MVAEETAKERRLQRSLHDLVRWAVEFYNNDYLFVELNQTQQNRIDRELRQILERLDVDFDGKKRPRRQDYKRRK